MFYNIYIYYLEKNVGQLRKYKKLHNLLIILNKYIIIELSHDPIIFKNISINLDFINSISIDCYQLLILNSFISILIQIPKIETFLAKIS